MGWGIDLSLRRSYITLRWRNGWALYWSQNATPWHHAARFVFGRKHRDGVCVCATCAGLPVTEGERDGE
jgi:hypothetical protein